MIISFADLLRQAQEEKFILGYFEAWDVYSLEAVVEAAEDEKSPVIIGFGGHTIDQSWFDGGGLERMGALSLTIGRQTKVMVSILLNEAKSLTQIVKGIKAGFNAVMLDVDDITDDNRLTATKMVVEISHPNGVGVEGERNNLADSQSAFRSSNENFGLSNAYQVAEFIEKTGIDALSVAIGNIHLQTDFKVDIDWLRLEEIHKQVKIPLVVHGGSSLPEDCINKLIEFGVAKVNVGTILKKVYFEGLRKALADYSPKINYQYLLGCRNSQDILNQAKSSLRQEIKRRIRLYRPCSN